MGRIPNLIVVRNVYVRSNLEPWGNPNFICRVKSQTLAYPEVHFLAQFQAIGFIGTTYVRSTPTPRIYRNYIGPMLNLIAVRRTTNVGSNPEPYGKQTSICWVKFRL